MSGDGLERSVAEAVNAWAHTQFGAPRNLAALVISTEERDQTIERAFTHVIRRDVVETQVATRETRSTHPRLDVNRVDPWSYRTNEQLKIDSEYVRQCYPCHATGTTTCGTCQGNGKSTCEDCNGHGKYRSKKTGNFIQCKHCRGNGIARCTECDGKKVVTCDHCRGSGHLLTWLMFHQRDRFLVDLSDPKSPIVVAHPALTHPGVLQTEDLSAFAVEAIQTSNGPSDTKKIEGVSRQLAEHQLLAVDPRLERVFTQQTMRLAVVRRDVRYEMCGTTGSLVLSGKTLSVTPNPDALKPIKRRTWMTVTLALALVAFALLVRAAVVGGTSYFFTARMVSAGLAVAVGGLAIPAFAGLLRSWRGGSQFRKLPLTSPIGFGGVAALVVAILVLGLLARPSRSEVGALLKSGDIAGARQVVEALQDDSSRDPEILDAEDRVKLAEAKNLKGDEQLALLDQVASRKGPAANEAATTARATRIATIESLISKNPTNALSTIERWFPASRTTNDPEIAEERAKAHDAARDRECASDACRLVEAIAARDAHDNPARSSAAVADRAKIVAALDIKKVDKDQLAHLQTARIAADTGVQVLRALPRDAELAASAKAAVEWGNAERAKVPLLTSPLPIVEELLASKANVEKSVASFTLDDVRLFAVMSGARCTGVYVVGKGDKHVYRSAQWSPDRILSMAFGRAAKVHDPSSQGSTATATWYEGGLGVVARWSDGDLIELRIGDATP